MKTKIIRLLPLIIIVILFINITRSWVKWQQRTQILENAKDRLYQQQEEQKNLERELARVQSKQYVEEQARDKLNMTREDEIMLIIPSPFIVQQPTPTPMDNSPNWQKWMRLFW